MSGKKGNCTNSIRQISNADTQRNALGGTRNSSRRRSALGFDGLEWEELEIILLVKPSALEDFDREPGSRSERQGIHYQLVYGVDLASLRLVVEKTNEAVSRLQHIDVPGDRLLRFWQSYKKSFRLVVA